MSKPYINLCCDFYKRNIFSGFAHLQEEQEFVDLTLAVDGYIVKVHKNIMALASAYIKDILKKSPSENLVIYLNNVNHYELNYLLEYIYQGEVNIPQERLEAFMQLAQSLRITGMAKPNTPRVERTTLEPQNMFPIKNIKESSKHRLAATKIEQLNTPFLNNNITVPEEACITVNRDQTYDIQQIPDNIEVSNMAENYQASIQNNTITEPFLTVADTITNIPGEDNIGDTNFEDNEDMSTNSNEAVTDIPINSIKEAIYIPTHSIETASYIPINSIEAPTCIPANSNEAATYITTNSDKVPTDITTISNEVATDIPTNSMEVANNIPINRMKVANDIPTNSIEAANNGENPTNSINIVSPCLSAIPENSKFNKITLKPLISLQNNTKEIPPEIDMNYQFDKESVDALKLITQYSVTERGSVQIIVSRYIYNSHHSSCGGRKHRWRCSDYRKKRCPAFIDSLDNHIVLRKGVHKHSYHDDKIYKKHEKGLIFYSLKQAQDVTKLPSIQTMDPDAEEAEDFEKSIDFKVISVQKEALT